MPAEGVDRFQRPEFIVRNDAGMEVCENRLSCELAALEMGREGADEGADLVAKGAVLRKGERLRSKFCKFSRGALVVEDLRSSSLILECAGSSDSLFQAILYVSDSERMYRCVLSSHRALAC